MNITTISSWVLLIAETLEHYGVDYRRLFGRLGMDVRSLSDANARFDFLSVTELWNMAVEETGDPCFGLSVVGHWRPTSLHALGFAWLASPTLEEAMHRLQRYVRIVNNATKVELENQGALTRMSISSSIGKNVASPAAADGSLAILVHMCRITSGNDLNPAKIYTVRPRPDEECVKKFEVFFKAPIHFGSDEFSIYFDTTALSKPLPASNVALARANDKVIDEYLSHLDGVSIGVRARAKIAELLPSGAVSEEKVAELFNMSVRTMQRKLKEEGISFKELLNSTRQELADQYMENSRLSINEITYMLGFSEPSNFTRAFRRWHGKSPSEYRAEHL